MTDEQDQIVPVMPDARAVMRAARERLDAAAGVPPEEIIEVPRYDRGFPRVAEAPFPETATVVLRRPVDPRLVEVKPNGIVFLPWVHVAARLNEAFGPGAWSIVPRDRPTTMGDTVIYNGALYILGRFVREAWGECEYRAGNSQMTYASALEGAQSDCLVRCCKVLGIGWELWDPGWREPFLAEHVLKAWLPATERMKAQWFFWRRDRPTPWQVTKANAKGQPASDLPVAPKGERVVVFTKASDIPLQAPREVEPTPEEIGELFDAPPDHRTTPEGTITPKAHKALEVAIEQFAKAWGKDRGEIRQRVKDRMGKDWGVEHFPDLTPEQHRSLMTDLGARPTYEGDPK